MLKTLEIQWKVEIQNEELFLYIRILWISIARWKYAGLSVQRYFMVTTIWPILNVFKLTVALLNEGFIVWVNRANSPTNVESGIGSIGLWFQNYLKAFRSNRTLRLSPSLTDGVFIFTGNLLNSPRMASNYR